MKLPCLVRDRSAWLTLTCIGTLVSKNTRRMECGVVRMGEPESATITVYLGPMIQ